MLKAKVLFLLLLVSALTLTAGTNRWSIHGPYGGDVFAVAFDPQVSGLVHAATDTGIFVSVDDGATWDAVPSVLGTPFNEIVAAQSDPRVLYASSQYGLHKSTDRGVSWSTVHGFASFGVAVSRQNPDVVYSVSGSVAMRSSDGGVTFTPGTGIPQNAGSLIQIVVDPANADIVYVCYLSSAGVYKSVDGGATWNRASTGLDASAYYSMNWDLATSTLYVGTVSGLFKTTNNAATWSKVTLPAPLTSAVIYSLASEGGRVFVGTNEGMLRQNGASFVRIGPPLGAVRMIGLSPWNVSLVLITHDFELLRSLDSGSTFAPANERITAMYTNAIATDPIDARVIYAGGPNGTFKSSDRGTTWTEIGARVTYLAVDGVDPQILYQISSGGFNRSTDGGATWLPFRTGFTSNPYKIFVDPSTRGTLYTFSDNKVFKKVGEAPWAATGSIPSTVSLAHLAVDPSNPSTLYVGGSALYKSTNGGATWAPLTISMGAVNGLVIDPFNPAHIIVADDFSLLESSDGGATWTTLSPQRTYALTFDHSREGRLYAIINGDTKRSDDGGKSWTHLSRGHVAQFAGDYITLSADGTTIYTAGRFGGVWTYTYGRQRPVR